MTYFSGSTSEKGCREYFYPWGKIDEETGAEETAWRCGDKWNGEFLFCPKCSEMSGSTK